MVIAVDFDGTIVEDRYPGIGKERPFATATLRRLIERGHRLILWTVREGELLDEAVAWCEERGVEFYADKLCLSPKYLSAVSKSICGYTVQELVFKAIIRKSISLLKNTQKDIQEISNAFGFPNASYFGTFFKKQVGVSPQQYRKNL